MLYKAVLVLLVTINLFVWSGYRYFGDRNLQIVFLDVGQGDSFLITTPDKVTLLVDAGKEPTVLEKVKQVIFPTQSINYILATHPDADHIGGFGELLEDFNPEGAVINTQVEPEGGPTEEYIALTAQLASKKMQIIPAWAGYSYLLGCCVKIDVVWPGADLKPDASTNDQSIAFYLSYGHFQLLAAGDLGTPYEEEVVKKKPPGPTTILKVGHHGSKSSSSMEFLEKLKPAFSVIQVGQDNSYGHPTPEVLSSLSQIGTKILRNDQHGNIFFSTDGTTLNYFTEKNL